MFEDGWLLCSPLSSLYKIAVAQNMMKGDTFDSKHKFKLAIVEAAVEDNCEVVFPQNNKERVKATCKSQACRFFVNARINPAGGVRVTSCDTCHSCVSRCVATSKGFWLTALAGSASREYASVCPADIIARAKTVHGIRVSYQQAHRALVAIRSKQLDSSRDSYGLVTPWLHAISQSNPGTVCNVVKPQGHLQAVYIFLQTSYA